MPTPNCAICAAGPKIQRNGGPVCGGAPFNLTNPSNDVQVVNVGLNGFNPKIVSKMIPPQRAPTDAAVAMKHVPIVVPVAHFTSRMLAGMNAILNKKITKSIFTGRRLWTSRLAAVLPLLAPMNHETMKMTTFWAVANAYHCYNPPKQQQGVIQQDPLLLLLRLKH